MNKRKILLAAGVLSCAATLSAVAGCNNDATEVATSPARTEQQRTQDIQSNPHMPPDAKAAAMAAMQRNQAAQAAAAQAGKQ